MLSRPIAIQAENTAQFSMGSTALTWLYLGGCTVVPKPLETEWSK